MANASEAGQIAAHAELGLIEALRQGDDDAFGRLVDEHHASLRRVARLYVSSRAVAAEVVQDTWVGVIQGIWAFEGRSSLKTWIFRILINHAKTRAVREGRMVPFAAVGTDDVGEPEAAVSPQRFHPADHPTEPGHWTRPPRDATTDFLAAGVERDEVCVLLGHTVANSRVLARLERRGLTPNELERRGRLLTVSGQQPADAMLREIGDRIRVAVDRGVPMVRVGNIGWEHPGWPAETDILQLEARVTDAVRNLPSVVVCAYGVRELSARSLLLGGLECHPFTLRRGALRRNEHHVPAERFLETLALDAA